MHFSEMLSEDFNNIMVRPKFYKVLNILLMKSITLKPSLLNVMESLSLATALEIYNPVNLIAILNIIRS